MESDSDGPDVPQPTAKDPDDDQLDGPFAGNDSDLIEDISSSGDNSDEGPNHNENGNEGHCEGSMYKEHKGVIPAIRSSSHHNGHLPSYLPEAHSSRSGLCRISITSPVFCCLLRRGTMCP